MLPACADQGMGLICWSPLGSGFLTGKYLRGDRPPEGTRMAHRVQIDVPRYWHENGFNILDQVMAVSRSEGKTAAQVALAWPLHDRRVTAVIIGATKVAQLDDNLAVGDWDLSDDHWQRLANTVPFDRGYPQEWIDMTYPNTFGDAEFPPS